MDINPELLMECLILIVCICIHEVGHIIPYVIYKRKMPKIDITLKQIRVYISKLNLGQIQVSLWAGILFGLIPILIMITHIDFWFMICLYIVLCSWDFMNSYLTFLLGKEDGFDKTYKQIEIKGIEYESQDNNKDT